MWYCGSQCSRSGSQRRLSHQHNTFLSESHTSCSVQWLRYVQNLLLYFPHQLRVQENTKYFQGKLTSTFSMIFCTAVYPKQDLLYPAGTGMHKLTIYHTLLSFYPFCWRRRILAWFTFLDQSVNMEVRLVYQFTSLQKLRSHLVKLFSHVNMILESNNII